MRPARRAALAVIAIPMAIALLAHASRADAEAPADAGAAPAREELSPEKLEALLTEVAKARQATRTLTASFTQERRLALLATSVKSTGTLAFLAPDRLRWELLPPDDVVYWIGPEGLSYRTRTSRATVPAAGANVARALADVRALLTGDVKSLGERYVLSGSRGSADVEIRGTARDPKASTRAFTLVLDKALVRPLRARLLEGKSDTIDLVFSNVVVDGPVDPKTMRP